MGQGKKQVVRWSNSLADSGEAVFADDGRHRPLITAILVHIVDASKWHLLRWNRMQ